MPGGAFVVGGCLLGLVLGCAGFGEPLDCLGVLSVAEGMRVVEAWKLASDFLPPPAFLYGGLSVWSWCELYCA